ncbi:MAG: radical SAM protein [Dehalococcoidia bacterium]|nr:radical SAM protein [Dehalococcoidia bacterium]
MNFYYEQPPFRPPTEAYSLLVRATRNCSWNRCEFCCMYKGAKLEIRTADDVKNDIRAMKMETDAIKEWAWKNGYGDRVGSVAQANGIYWLNDGVVKHAFIADSNSIIMKAEDLAEIVRFLYETFPTLERVTSYGRAKTLVKKTPEELKMLREAGLTRLHVGLETGDEELLKIIQKGATPDEMILGGQKALQAGFELSEYIMPGLGGQEKWEQHSRGTARVLNEINPHFIRLRTLFVVPGTPLAERYERGEFSRQTIDGLLREVRLLIEELSVSSDFVVSDHIANRHMWGIDGKPSLDKEQMLQAVDDLIAAAKESDEKYPVYSKLIYGRL